MKKIFFVLMAVATVFGMVSCSSTGSADGSGSKPNSKAAKEQAKIDQSFDKVYATYSDKLVLDGAETYTVQSGDTLTAITKQFYGDENGYYFPLIMLASRDVVKDPEFIKPGMELTVPNFDANVNDKEVAKGLKPYFKGIADVYKQKKTPTAPDIRENLLKISEQLGND